MLFVVVFPGVRIKVLTERDTTLFTSGLIFDVCMPMGCLAYERMNSSSSRIFAVLRKTTLLPIANVVVNCIEIQEILEQFQLEFSASKCVALS